MNNKEKAIERDIARKLMPIPWRHEEGENGKCKKCGKQIYDMTKALGFGEPTTERWKECSEPPELEIEQAITYINQLQEEIERLRKIIKNNISSLMIMKNTKSDDGIKDLPQLAAKLQEYNEQFLKGGEKCPQK